MVIKRKLNDCNIEALSVLKFNVKVNLKLLIKNCTQHSTECLKYKNPE